MRFSVVTTCYQAEAGIRSTIESVLSQTATGFEYVIKDGGSSDRTLEIAESFRQAFADRGISFRIVSEKDGGIYQGMNAGAELACGEYINFMNAGDRFFDAQVLSRIEENVFQKSGQAFPDVIYGDAAEYECGSLYYFSKDFGAIRRRMPFSHQSVFARRELLRKHPFRTEYRIAADYDFLLNCLEDGAVFEDCGVVVAEVSKDGLSSVDLYHTFTETQQMLRSHGIVLYDDKTMKKKLFFLRIRQFGMDHLPGWVKVQIRLVQRKQRGQDRKVSRKA